MDASVVLPGDRIEFFDLFEILYVENNPKERFVEVPEIDFTFFVRVAFIGKKG